MRSSSPIGRMATAVFLAGFLFGLFSASAFSWNPADDTNVNSRYTVESVQIAGANEEKLSKGLREEMQRHVGQRFSPEAFAQLAGRVRNELKARIVSPKLLRGTTPESVRVVLDVMDRRLDVTAAPSRFAWHSLQGWTGDLSVSTKGLRFGVFSDGDTHIERVAGVRAGYQARFLNNRVQPGFQFSTLHAQYDARTLAAAAPGELYRNVDSFQPAVKLIPWRGSDQEELAIEIGMRFQRFQLESPGLNRNVASHALVNTLRYQRVRGDALSGRTVMTAAYTLTNAIAPLGSDYRFNRQEVHGDLEYEHDRSRLTVTVTGGALNGKAPLLDRFAAGNTTLLRGWNKWEITPLGADRLIASTVEYGHKIKTKTELAAFVDSGSVWNRGSAVVARTSVGCGIRTRDGFFLYLAFPLREGRIEPLVMTGATF